MSFGFGTNHGNRSSLGPGMKLSNREVDNGHRQEPIRLRDAQRFVHSAAKWTLIVQDLYERILARADGAVGELRPPTLQRLGARCLSPPRVPPLTDGARRPEECIPDEE